MNFIHLRDQKCSGKGSALMAALMLMISMTGGRAQNLIHRYSFDSDASDIVGTADGELMANAVIINGAVSLDGVSAYVNLPNDLLTSLTGATFEMWVIWKGGGPWQRIVDFGNSTAGEDLQGAATQSIFLTPNNGGGMVLSIFPDGIGGQQVVNGPALTRDALRHIVWTYDATAMRAVLYVDGVQVGVNTNMTHTLAGLGSTANNWLGHSQYVQDSDFFGSIAEFRIYDGPITTETVLTNFTQGPDPSGRGALDNINLAVRSIMRPGGVQQIRVLANYENVADVDITSDSGVTFQISDPSAVSIIDGRLSSLGTGNATVSITVSFGGKTNVQQIQIALPEEPVLLHRYSFAADASDSAGDADGELVANATISNGAVVLDGVEGYVNLPNDLVAGLTNATFEIWTTWNGGANWQRMIDFGNSNNEEDIQGAATQSIFLTPRNDAGVLDVSIFPNGIGNQQVITAPGLSTGILHHIVWTYDAVALAGRLYVDGSEVGVNSNMTHTLSGLGSTKNNWLGHSQYIQDSDYAGSIAEFRIYNGVLSAAAIATNNLAGPDPGARGAVLSLEILARDKMRPGSMQKLTVLADFENIADVEVTLDAALSLQLSDPASFQITNGFLTATGSGSATGTITATFSGKTAIKVIEIVPRGEATLVHHYTFAENANDSAGTAHGELVGNASISNGSVVLSGTDSYVNLPNNLVATFTNVTIELWATWNGGNNWQRIFDFGNSNNGEDVQGAATQSIFLTPNNGGGMVLSMFPDGIGGQQTVTGPALTTGAQHHIVWNYDAIEQISRLYVDGTQVGVNSNMTYTLAGLGSTLNNWIGHSQYIQDADFNGSVAEFRIFNAALSASEVAAHLAAGPDTLPGPAENPSLTVAKAGGQISISWPEATQDFYLQFSGSLGSAAVWNAVSEVPTIADGKKTVTVQAAETSRFYRLRK
jgi:hypothetical protein